MNRNDCYAAAYIAVFGVLWGAIEILLGNTLHMFEIPFKGTILSSLGCIICLIGYSMQSTPKNFSIVYIGLVAIIIRLFSFGIFKIHIFLSMFTEVILLQLAVSIIGNNLIGFIIAGILATLSPYISGALFFGIIIDQGLTLDNHGIGKDSASVAFLFHGFVLALIFILVVNVIIGILTGIVAFYFRQKLIYAAKS